MTYELWNTRSRNLVASFEDEGAALTFVRDELLEHGAEYVTRLALAREGEDGRSELVASGPGLIERARHRQSHPAPQPPSAPP
jgi:hypothetical protein